MTIQRQIIIGVIGESEDHPDVDELYRRSVEQDSTISIATVYRTVKLLEEAGVIERLEFGDGRARYEEAGEHHEHLVDVETGKSQRIIGGTRKDTAYYGSVAFGADADTLYVTSSRGGEFVQLYRVTVSYTHLTLPTKA